MDTPKLNFAHVCDYAFNGEGGKPCIIGIFKNITVQNSDQPHPQMFIITNITVQSGREYEQTIKFVRNDNPDENIIKPIVASFSVVKENNPENVEIGFIGQINNVKFQQSGQYAFKIFIDNVLLKQIPVDVVVSNVK